MSQQRGLQTTRQPANGALVRRLPMAETGMVTTNSAQEASTWIEAAYEAGGQVVTPFNHVPDLAPGFGIAYSEVDIRDLSPQGNDLYPITGATGRFGLHKAPLDAIGRGYGVDWPREWTRDEKFNDERDHDPYCKKVSVAGRYRDADGEWKSLPPLEKEIDLRESYVDSRTGEVKVPAEVMQIRANHEYKETKDLPAGATAEAREQRLKIARRKADTELAQLRKFIGMHARTKARLAVIRTLVRGSYTLPELQAGPFRIFRVIKNYKAPADRPDLQAKIDDAAVNRLMASSELLYGASISQRTLPPVSDEDSPPPEDAGVVAEVSAEPSTEVVIETSQNAATTTAATTEPTTKTEPYVLKSGKHAGKLVEALPDSSLSMLTGYYDHLATLTVKDETQLADIQADRTALLAEVKSRQIEQAQGESQGELKL